MNAIYDDSPNPSLPTWRNDKQRDLATMATTRGDSGHSLTPMTQRATVTTWLYHLYHDFATLSSFADAFR
jgi:hypothetical protein